MAITGNTNELMSDAIFSGKFQYVFNSFAVNILVAIFGIEIELL